MSLRHTLSRLGRKLSIYFKEAGLFISSRVFLRNFFVLILILVVVLRLTFCSLGCYTGHGESVTVPNLEGMDIVQAKKVLSNAHLSIQVIDSLYDPKKEPLLILKQEPVAGEKVKRRRTIYLTLNSSQPPMVTLPEDLDYGMDDKTAEDILNSMDIQVQTKEYVVDKATDPVVLQVKYKGKVLMDSRDNIKPDKNKPIRLPRGAQVVLVVSKGAGEDVDIPNLVCRTADEARFLINSAELSLGVIIADGTVKDTAAAYVYKQQPEFDEEFQMRKGESVDLWITQSPPSDCGGTEKVNEEE